MRKTQETKLSEIFSLYLALAAARGVKDKTLRTYEQHFNAISKRLDVDSKRKITLLLQWIKARYWKSLLLSIHKITLHKECYALSISIKSGNCTKIFHLPS